MLQPFNTTPRVVVTPNHKIISLLHHNCNFATVMNHIANIWYAWYLLFNPQGGHDPQVENHWSRELKKRKCVLKGQHKIRLATALLHCKHLGIGTPYPVPFKQCSGKILGCEQFYTLVFIPFTNVYRLGFCLFVCLVFGFSRQGFSV